MQIAERNVLLQVLEHEALSFFFLDHYLGSSTFLFIIIMSLKIEKQL